VLAIQPGASHQSKRWTPNGFAQVACRSMIDNDSLSVWILGGPDEAQAASDVVEAIDPRFRHRVLNLAGKLKLRETMFAISRASLFLGNDTAIRHVAIALDVPSIGLFGPTSAEKWGNAVPMKHLVLRSQSSDMADLPFQSVLEPVAHLLSKSYAHIV
jgi:heptosyltransferase-2